MKSKDTMRRSLDRRLAALDPDVPPERDLWPGIVAAIDASGAGDKPPRAVALEAAPEISVHAGAARRWPLALAAGFALVALVGALFGWQLARMRPATVASAPPPSITAPLPPDGDAFAGPDTANFRATRASLEQTYQQRLALLAPATRRRVEQDLATIRAANADIRKALEADPQSAVLNHLLATTLHQEFDLYATVIRNTAPAVPRSPS
jgi:hypothetical protein